MIRRLARAAAVLLYASAAAAQSYTFDFLAGNDGGIGFADGYRTEARFNFPEAVAVDASGNLYVADSRNHTVRKISPDGFVSTLAGTQSCSGSFDSWGPSSYEGCFSNPKGLAVDTTGTVYVADGCVVRKVSPAGVVTTLAGDRYCRESRDGRGTAAAFMTTSAVAVGPDGALYVSDLYSIRKVLPDGLVSTVAGSTRGMLNGPGATALFAEPKGIAVDRSGNVFVADNGNQRIRRIAADSVVSTYAGTGVAETINGPALSASFNRPVGVAVDAAGNVYVSESWGEVVRKITPAGDVSTLAGNPVAVGAFDGIGANASFEEPLGIAVDSAGILYVSDAGASVVRRVGRDGAVTSIAGKAANPGFGDGRGAAAAFKGPRGLAVDASGTVFVSDTGNDAIRKIAPSGDVTTIAGYPQTSGGRLVDGPGSSARFSSPLGLAVDSTGNLFVADGANYAVRRITPAADVSTIWKGTSWTLDAAIDTDGSLLVSGLGTLRRRSPSGVWTSGSLASGSDWFDIAGGMLFYGTYNRVRRVEMSGADSVYAGTAIGTFGEGAASEVQFLSIQGLATDAASNVYVADRDRLRKISTLRNVTTIAGVPHGDPWPPAGGTSEILFVQLGAVVSVPNGTLYVTDQDRHSILIGRPSIPTVATIAKNAALTGEAVQLGVSAPASSYRWRVLQRPPGSVADVTNPLAPNPTFKPDVYGLYVLLLRAESPAGVRYSRVQLAAQCEALSGVYISLPGGTLCSTDTRWTATAVSTGGGALTYQWGWSASPNGVMTPIPGATGRTYPVRYADFGTGSEQYLLVRVTPECGAPVIRSTPITLVDRPLPVAEITAPAIQPVTRGYIASVPDAGAFATYRWEVLNGRLESGGDARQITFSSGFNGRTTLEVTVTDRGCWNSGSLDLWLPPADLYLVPPCRVLDTREPGSYLAEPGTTHWVHVTGKCGIPVGARAVAVNVTVVSPGAEGWLAVYPSGTSIINYRRGKTRANNAILPLSGFGELGLINHGPQRVHFIIDVSGYYK